MKLTKIARPVRAALAAAGAELIRSKNHPIFRFPNGKQMSMSLTASDSARAIKNQLADIRRISQ